MFASTSREHAVPIIKLLKYIFLRVWRPTVWIPIMTSNHNNYRGYKNKEVRGINVNFANNVTKMNARHVVSLVSHAFADCGTIF